MAMGFIRSQVSSVINLSWKKSFQTFLNELLSMKSKYSKTCLNKLLYKEHADIRNFFTPKMYVFLFESTQIQRIPGYQNRFFFLAHCAGISSFTTHGKRVYLSLLLLMSVQADYFLHVLLTHRRHIKLRVFSISTCSSIEKY